MRIITVSREFGSGGRELGKRLADELNYDYYDREIIAAISAEQGLDEQYIENTLEMQSWQNYPLTFGATFAGGVQMQSPQVELLLKQKAVIERIAERGRDCVIVGRNADVILREYKPFNIFVCADTESKVRRCTERTDEGEQMTQKQIEQMIKRVDKNRAYTRAMTSGSKWGERTAYHITVNTTGWVIKDLTPAIADFAVRWFECNNSSRA